MIQIYSQGNKNFQQNGDITLLPDNAITHVELNGAWSHELHHPIDKEGRWKYLVEDAVIKAPSFNGEQLFRIYNKEKSDDGVSVKAYPIFFDAKNDCFLVDVRPTNKNGQDALNIMCAVNNKYSAESDISRASTSYFEYMNLLEAIGGDSENSFLKRWGGEVLYDNFKVIVNEQVGGDYGVEIRYGKNIPANGVREEVDMSEVVTRIYPKAFNGRKLTSGFVDSPIIGNYETVRATTMKFENIKLREDVDGDATEEDVIICETQAELDAELAKKCKEQFDLGLDKPKVTIDADMVLLQNTEEYKDYKILESVSLGDTIHCKHNKLGIITDARVISLEYDCLLKRVTSVKFGDFKKNYFDNVTDNVHKIESIINPSGNVMADKVAGILDGVKTQMRAQSTIAKKQNVRAMLFEDLDPESPTFGAMAIGTMGFQIAGERTSDGKNWKWTTFGTGQGFFADFIVAGTMLADRIQGGTLTLGGLNDQNGVLIMQDANGNEIGRWNCNGLNATGTFFSKSKKDKSGVIIQDGMIYFKNELGETTGVISYINDGISLDLLGVENSPRISITKTGQVMIVNTAGTGSITIGGGDSVSIDAKNINIGNGKTGRAEFSDGTYMEFKGGVLVGGNTKEGAF